MADDVYVINPTLRASILLEWVDATHGRQRLWVDPIAEPEIVDFGVRLLTTRGDLNEELTPSIADRLTKLGVLVESVSALQPIAPDFRLPDDATEAIDTQHCVDLEVNDKCYIQNGPRPPIEITQRIKEAWIVPRSGPTMWVDDVGTGILAVYDLNSPTGRWALALKHGNKAIMEAPAHVRTVLALSRILVPRDYNVVRAKKVAEELKHAQRQWTAQKCAVIRRLINPIQLMMYADYFRRLAAVGHLKVDQTTPGRLTMYREPLCEYIHGQVAELVGRVLGENVKCSYSLYGLYNEGSSLERHRDRPQCKWNVSMVIDAEPAPTTEDEAWPLFIETNRVHTVRLCPGDAVLYSGADNWHWREALHESRRVGVALLHFVQYTAFETLD